MPHKILTYNQALSFINNGEIPKFAHQPSLSQFSSRQYKLFKTDVSLADLDYLYTRCDIAANAVDTPVEAVWSKGWTVKPVKTDSENQQNPTVKALNALNESDKLNVKQAFIEAHENSRLYGLGLIVLGLSDNQSLATPLKKASALEYLAVFSSLDVERINYNEDLSSSEYGEIVSYDLKLAGDTQQKVTVHSSRVIHLNERTRRRSPWGISILTAAYDLFQILKNTDWSAGEAYYQNASPLYELTWSEQAENPPSLEEKTRAADDLEDLHAKKRFMHPEDWHLNVIQGSGRIADPNLIWAPIIERIAGRVGVPKQILLGTSAGALASSETNLQQWYKDIAELQHGKATQWLRRFYSILMDAGVVPKGEYQIEWPTLWEMDEKEKAEIKKLKVEAAQLALQSGLITLEEARADLLDYAEQVPASKYPFPYRQTTVSATPANPNMATPDNSASSFTVNMTDKQRSGTPVLRSDRLPEVLQLLATQVMDKALSFDEALREGTKIIDNYTKLEEQNALAWVRGKTGYAGVVTLSPEMQRDLERQHEALITDFKKMLLDAQSLSEKEN